MLKLSVHPLFFAMDWMQPQPADGPKNQKQRPPDSTPPRRSPLADLRGRSSFRPVRSAGRTVLPLAVCGLLFLGVIVIFGQTARHDFVNYDDDLYVFRNQMVLHGLTERESSGRSRSATRQRSGCR